MGVINEFNVTVTCAAESSVVRWIMTAYTLRFSTRPPKSHHSLFIPVVLGLWKGSN